MKELATKLLRISLAAVLYAIGFSVFFEPNNIAPGGFTGISMLISYVTGGQTGVILMCMNIPLWLIAYRKLGKYFMLSTIYAVTLTSALFDVIGSNFAFETDPLLAAIYGAIFFGLGLGIIFAEGSSTGGSDIITQLVRIVKPHMSIGQVMLILDFFVVVASIIVFKNINNGLYTVIALYIVTKIIDMVIEGPDGAKLVYIISKKNDEIAIGIVNDVGRGATILDGHGAYTKEAKDVIMCALRVKQIPELKRRVSEIDNEAFMIVTDVKEVLGHGFKIDGKRKK